MSKASSAGFSCAHRCIPAEPKHQEDAMKSIFDMNHYTMNESTLMQQLVQRLIVESEGNVFYRSVRFSTSQTKRLDARIVNEITDLLQDVKASMPYDERTIYILGNHKMGQVFISVFIEYATEASTAEIKLYGPLPVVESIKLKLEETFHDEVLPSIKWWYVGPHGDTTRDYYLPKDNIVIRSEFYPDLTDPDRFLKEYMESDEAILLVAGPPGTGKTTLLRYLINKYKLSAHVIYDERLMEKDGPFQSFLFGERKNRYISAENEEEGGDIMIIEDADTMLASRERDGNKLMSRFLNISDGLIKLPNKKLIFTTNIANFENVDHALIRPGRCFGVMKTRELNLTEAQAAARVAELPIPTEKREYTLAELFNQGKTTIVRTIGFGARH